MYNIVEIVIKSGKLLACFLFFLCFPLRGGFFLHFYKLRSPDLIGAEAAFDAAKSNMKGCGRGESEALLGFCFPTVFVLRVKGNPLGQRAEARGQIRKMEGNNVNPLLPRGKHGFRVPLGQSILAHEAARNLGYEPRRDAIGPIPSMVEAVSLKGRVDDEVRRLLNQRPRSVLQTT